MPTAAWGAVGGEARWPLAASDGSRTELRLQPRFVCDDIAILRQAVVDGIGIAMIPKNYVADDLAQGRLVQVQADLAPMDSIVHVVHLGRLRMRPAVRHLLDSLKASFPAF